MSVKKLPQLLLLSVEVGYSLNTKLTPKEILWTSPRLPAYLL